MIKYILIGIAVALSGCVNGSVAVPGYTVSATAVTVGPVGLGSASISVQPHTDTFGNPSPTPSK